MWILDKTSIPAYTFILNFTFADITLILNLDILNIRDISTDLNDTSDYMIWGYSFNEGDSVVSGEVIDRVCDLANNYQVISCVLQLHVYVDTIRHFSQCISYQYYLVFLEGFFKIDFFGMLNKHSHSALIIYAFQVNLWSQKATSWFIHTSHLVMFGNLYENINFYIYLTYYFTWQTIPQKLTRYSLTL